MVLHATVSLAGPNAAPLGEQRIALLEAVAREGSISAAARALGLSYRGAWDAICAMNALVGRPLVAGRTGGRRGGGAALTDDGRRLVDGFRRLEAEMARAFDALARDLDPGLAGEGPAAVDRAEAGFRRTSARNALPGRIAAAAEGPVSAEVRLEIGAGQTLAVSLTSRSLRALGLAPGRRAVALVKAPMIALVPAGDAPALPPAAPAANRIEGVVASVARDALSTEVILDIGGGRSLCAVLAEGAGAASAFVPGDRAAALIDPAHVILAVE